METTEKKLRENARKALLVAIKVAAKEGGITAAKEFAEAYDLDLRYLRPLRLPLHAGRCRY